MSQVRADKTTGRTASAFTGTSRKELGTAAADIQTATADLEPGRGTKKSRTGKTLFKYMDRAGWERDTGTLDFDSVMKKLRKLRKNGRQGAIIVDSGFKQRP